MLSNFVVNIYNFDNFMVEVFSYVIARISQASLSYLHVSILQIVWNDSIENTI